MNKKQRFIASCCNPYYDSFASRAEIKEAKLLARGKYWVEDYQFGCPKNEEDRDTFCAYSPTGKREFFQFDLESGVSEKQKEQWKKIARQACRLWCKGKYKQSLQIYSDICK